MKKLNKKEKKEVLDILASMYPDAGCQLNFTNTFELVVAVSLSAQTTDKRVNEVTKSLFEKYPDVYSISQIPLEQLELILKPLGMYKNKSKNLLAMCDTLIRSYDGNVPDTFDELVELPGVGRKTANVVLSVGFGVPRIAVDTHVFRVSNRIGLACAKNELKTEEELMAAIPKENWTANHHRLIMHGRNVCMARKPNCSECALNGLCVEYRENIK